MTLISVLFCSPVTFVPIFVCDTLKFCDCLRINFNAAITKKHFFAAGGLAHFGVLEQAIAFAVTKGQNVGYKSKVATNDRLLSRVISFQRQEPASASDIPPPTSPAPTCLVKLVVGRAPRKHEFGETIGLDDVARHPVSHFPLRSYCFERTEICWLSKLKRDEKQGLQFAHVSRKPRS